MAESNSAALPRRTPLKPLSRRKFHFPRRGNARSSPRLFEAIVPSTLMSGCFELARPVECSRAGFEYDCAPIDLREDREELVAHHSALQHEFPRMAGNSLQDAANSLLGLINSLFGEN